MSLKKIWFKITHWESWHYHAKYIPLAPVWLWYCIKARSFWFFTASNPTITFGGFEGEGKKEIYEQLPAKSFPKSIFISPGTKFSYIENLLSHKQFVFPFIVKPDVGTMGYMFRKISNIEQLQLYHDTMPVNYIIQKMVEYPVEVTVFYYRMPHSKKGTVSGFLMKKQPEVTGDGKSTLEELIVKSDDLKYKIEEISMRHRTRLKRVLQKGEKFILSYASNRSQGGKLISLEHEIDEKLLALFNCVSNSSRHFYYGRYDIKCTSIEDLKNGTGFSILEYNGAGAGVQHIYGNRLSLRQAWGVIIKHWKMLYTISAYNHKENKVPYWEYKKGKQFLNNAMKNVALLKKLDDEFPVFS